MTQAVRRSKRPTDYRWDQLKAAFKANCRTTGAKCWLCILRGDVEHADIDYSAPPQSSNAFEADHYYPWDSFPHLRYQWSNLRASHARCNRQRRNDMPGPPQAWVKPDW